MDKKVKLKPNVYAIVSEAVEDGIMGGLNKAQKHDVIKLDFDKEGASQYVYNYVMGALCEVIKFE